MKDFCLEIYSLARNNSLALLYRVLDGLIHRRMIQGAVFFQVSSSGRGLRILEWTFQRNWIWVDSLNSYSNHTISIIRLKDLKDTKVSNSKIDKLLVLSKCPKINSLWNDSQGNSFFGNLRIVWRRIL